jgi:hypothetical protein
LKGIPHFKLTLKQIGSVGQTRKGVPMSGPALLVANQPSQAARQALNPSQNKGQGEGLPQGEKGFAELLGEVEEIAGLAPELIDVQPLVPAGQGGGVVVLPRGEVLDADAILAAAGDQLASQPEIGLAGASSKQLGLRPTEAAAPSRAAPSLRPAGAEGGDLRREVIEQAPLVRPAAPDAAVMRGAPSAPTAEELRGELQVKSPPKVQIPEAAELRAETVQHQAARPDTSNAVVRQVATNLQFIARGDVEKMRFDLHPEELGRVQIQLQKTGTVTRVTIVTETAQAFEALARGAHGLQQNLSQAGFETDDLRFSHREEQDHREQRQTFEERRDRDHHSRRETSDQDERREVLIRPALTAADRQLFL